MKTHLHSTNTSRTPGELPLKERQLRASFLQRVHDIPGGEKINRCIQCGTCSGSCPVSWAMDLMPRELITRFRAGDIESILHSKTIWLCASCYACTQRCPQGIKVTEIIYSLKRLAVDTSIYPDGFGAHVFPKLFVDIVNRYGRNHELGLMKRYYLKTDPMHLIRMASIGLEMMRKKRMSIRPPRVSKALKDIRTIIKHAEKFDLPKESFRPEYEKEMVGYRAIDKPTNILIMLN